MSSNTRNEVEPCEVKAEFAVAMIREQLIEAEEGGASNQNVTELFEEIKSSFEPFKELALLKQQ